MADISALALTDREAQEPLTMPGSVVPPAVSALFPSLEKREAQDDRLTRELLAAGARIVASAVTPTLDMAIFRRELAGFDFAAPQANESVLCWVITQLEQGITHVTHPRYFGLFNPAPTFPAQCADRIAAVFNPQLATSTTSPVAVAIEAHVIRAVLQRVGFGPEASGHFTTGGGGSELYGPCSLTRAHPEFATKGARAFGGPPVFYTSQESHFAWFKIAHQAGIGRDAVHLVATDGTGRLDPRALAAAIAADQANGRVPVMIAATAGTTNAGMVDPLPQCAELAQEAGLWLHVDAAWGGALVATEAPSAVLRGIEQADSVTIDAHKWFATTMGCGMFLTRHAALLPIVFQVSASYMPSNIGDVDPYVTSVQWSRRFVGLRLFMSLAAAGWDGYARHVRRALALAAMLRVALEARGWSIANRSPMAVLCIEPPRGSTDIRTIVGRVVASGRAWISAAEFEGRPVIRACMTHGETTSADVAALVEELEGARE